MHMLMDVLLAQKANLERLESELLLEGTTGAGNQIILKTPRPELIRLLDTPLHLQQRASRTAKSYERIITLAPVRMANAGKIAGRRDERATYVVHGLVTLTEAERSDDEKGKYTANPLANKLMEMAGDVEDLIFDDLHLGGIVQDIEAFESSFDIDYPVATFSLAVTCTISGRRCH